MAAPLGRLRRLPSMPRRTLGSQCKAAMTRNARLLLTGLGCLALGAGAVGAWRTQLSGGDVAACRGGAAPLARVELLFGTSRKDGGTVAEADWQAFLDTEVT